MKRSLHLIVLISLLSYFPFSLISCGEGGKKRVELSGDTIPFRYAKNLQMVRHDGYVKVTVRNPWDTLKLLHTYYLVPDSVEEPEDLGDGTVVKTPLKNSLVYSSVQQSLLAELGKTDAIGGIMDKDYINDSTLLSKIESGEITVCGTNTTPDFERIVRLKPDGILLSPYNDSGDYGKISQLGIPMIECVDFMEDTPLGRVEWLKFFGLLYGSEEKAEKMFEKTEREYNQLKGKVVNVATRPSVLLDKLYGQGWNLPGKSSSTNVFISDAGGLNPFESVSDNVNVTLSGEQVLHKAGDVDFWLVRYWQTTDKTLKELSEDSPLYSQFKAFKEGKVYGCNTKEILFYEEVPYHPQWLLAELISILHPEIDGVETSGRYFTPLK